MYQFFKSKKGFTLVELMIVVVIIAILVAVAVPIYRSVTSKARASTCADNRRQIKSQLSMYYMQHTELLNDLHGECTFTTGADNGKSVTFSGDPSIRAMFDENSPPCCPVKNGVITVTYNTVNSTGEEELLNIEISCSIHGE